MPDELCVSKHVVLCFLLGGNQSYCVRHDQWWREDALQLRQQPELEVDWSTANSWVFCGFFTISPVISQVISRGSFLAGTFVETHQGLLFWKVKMWPPCRSLSWWTSIMACPLAILVITCFFSQICCEKKRHGAFGAFQAFVTLCRTFIQVLGHIGHIGGAAPTPAWERTNVACMWIIKRPWSLTVALPLPDDGMGRLRKAMKGKKKVYQFINVPSVAYVLRILCSQELKKLMSWSRDLQGAD